MARRRVSNRNKLALTKDLYRRKQLMLERYGYNKVTQLAEQYGFSDINDPTLIDLLVPAKDNEEDTQVDFQQEETIDSDSVDAQKRRNKKSKRLTTHPNDIKFNTDGASTDGKIHFDRQRAGMYRTILEENSSTREMEHPKVTLIEPTEEDIKTGFIFRYFLQQSNSPTAPLVEVDKDQYESWLKSGGGIDRDFYNGVLLKWRIRGNLQTTTGNDGIVRKGVLEGNQASIDLASETLPALKLQVTNLVKYWSR